jgi:O-antigen/teichoic acid export membrane protein
MFEFAIGGLLIFSYGFYDWTFCSEGVRGVKVSVFVVLIVALINVIFSLITIPKIGMSGAISSIGFSYFVGLICFQFLKNKIA